MISGYPIAGNAFDAKQKKRGGGGGVGWPYKPTFKFNLPPGSVAKSRLCLQNNCKFHKFKFYFANNSNSNDISQQFTGILLELLKRRNF